MGIENIKPFNGIETVYTNGRVTSERYWRDGKEVTRNEYKAPRDSAARLEVALMRYRMANA